jgi:hypothetical protein
MSTQTDRWTVALDRASVLAATVVPGGEGHWDFVAVRGVLAVTIYALAVRDSWEPRAVPLDDVAEVLEDRDSYLTLADVLTAGGHALDDTTGDPVAAQWSWLLRHWDPGAPPHLRWDGLTRGIGRGLPDPAIDVVNSWARIALTRASEPGECPARVISADRADALWGQSARHADGLLRWSIADDPRWWDRVRGAVIDTGSVSTLLGYAIWQAALDEVGVTPVSEYLDADALASTLAAEPNPLERPDGGPLAGLVALAADPARRDEWTRLTRVTRGVLTRHVIDSGVPLDGHLTLGERQAARQR